MRDEYEPRLNFYKQVELLAAANGLIRKEMPADPIISKRTKDEERMTLGDLEGAELQAIYSALSYCRSTLDRIWLWHKMNGRSRKDLFILEIKNDYQEEFLKRFKPSIEKCKNIEVWVFFWSENRPKTLYRKCQ
jgi:hypothetical protein